MNGTRTTKHALKHREAWWQDPKPQPLANGQLDDPRHDELISDFERACGPIESETRRLLIRTFAIEELPALELPSQPQSRDPEPSPTNGIQMSSETRPRLRRRKKFVLSKAQRLEIGKLCGIGQSNGAPTFEPAQCRCGGGSIMASGDGCSGSWSTYHDRLRRGECEGVAWCDFVDAMMESGRFREHDGRVDAGLCSDDILGRSERISGTCPHSRRRA